MSLSISNEAKANLTVSNTAKPTSETWSSTPGRTWGDGGTWGDPGTVFFKEAKSSLSISNESKV